MAWLNAQLQIYERFRAFAAAEVSPLVLQNDAAQRLDRELWKRIGQSGLFGLQVPKALGGEGLGFTDFVAALEGFATGSGDLGLAVSIVAHAGCAIPAVVNFGTEPQQRTYLPKLISGEWLAGIANAEPRAGTDVLAMRSRATAVGSGWKLNARKRSITNIGSADLILTSARTGAVGSKQAFSVFCVQPQQQVWQRPSHELMGLRTSATGSLVARNAMVPGDALLGSEGHALPFFRFVFGLERLLIGSLFLVAIERSLSRAVQVAETRTAFGDVLGRNQYVQEKVVRMRVSAELLSALLERTRAAFLAGADVSAALSILKFQGAEAAGQATEDLMGLLGGRGMLKANRAEKDFRDVFGLSILGGTQELQKIVIYRETVKEMLAGRNSETEVEVEVVPFRQVDRSLESALIALVGRAFPTEPTVAGRYYYDTVPDALVVARVKNRVVGFRMICRRDVKVGETPLRAVGIGIAVDPDFQQQGIGKLLTAETIRHLQSQGDEVALAFLLNRNAEPLLSSFGFRKLNAEVSYTNRETGQRVVEAMPCFARELIEGGAALERIEKDGALFLGLGTW